MEADDDGEEADEEEDRDEEEEDWAAGCGAASPSAALMRSHVSPSALAKCSSTEPVTDTQDDGLTAAGSASRAAGPGPPCRPRLRRKCSSTTGSYGADEPASLPKSPVSLRGGLLLGWLRTALRDGGAQVITEGRICCWSMVLWSGIGPPPGDEPGLPMDGRDISTDMGCTERSWGRQPKGVGDGARRGSPGLPLSG